MHPSIHISPAHLRSIRFALMCLIAVAMTAMPSRSSAGEPVSLDSGGLKLNALLELADGKQLADGLVLLTHGTLAHNQMEIIATLQQLLKERGRSSLAINLSLGINDRASAMYDCPQPHRHKENDAVDEISAWVDWLKAKGAADITIIGHSRGGMQTARYAAGTPDAAVRRVVLVAPGIWTAEDAAASYEKTYQTPLAPLLTKAEEMVAGGKGDTMLEHIGILYCADTSATAASFASYYGATPDHDSPTLMPRIKLPTLVIAGSEDNVVKGLPERVAALADGQRPRLKVIDGADHFFQDLYADEAADDIDGFITETGAN